MLRLRRSFAFVAFLVSSTAVLITLAAGPGYRFGLLSLFTAFSLIKLAVVVGFVGWIASLAALGLGLFRTPRAGIELSMGGLLLGALVVAPILSMKQKADRVPPIHDISTDTDRPPEFQALLAERASGSNPSDYGGPEVAAQQHEAYPDVQPLDLPLPANTAFANALSAAKGMGWKIADENRESGTIEATATSWWFGFKDDVIVRIKPRLQGSRVDVRSVSREGVSDLGVNAARIRAFLIALKK